MARKSKFRNITQETPKPRVYHAGAYVRLSVLDGHQRDSDSIENQELLVRSYIEKEPSLILVSVYSDNGETGVNFQRDDFKRLLDDIQSGKIDCVIVKDLSRFGRNYIEAGEYLEKIFPFLGVRFIAVNDGYDSLDPATSDVLSMHLKNLVNDVYARDISRKICPVMRAKQERGEYIGNWIYGYVKSKEDKHCLVVDEETAPIVREIFKQRLSGKKYAQIARDLNQQKIPSPNRYRFEKGMVKDKRFAAAIWKGDVIKQILSNECYLGHMVQGKTQTALWNGMETAARSKDKWVIVNNTHEPIITQQAFDAVQRINEKREREYAESRGKFSEVKSDENILKGLVYCGSCGSKMMRQRHVWERKKMEPKYEVRYRFACPTHAASPSLCEPLRVKEADLLDAVSCMIKVHLATAIDMEKLIESMSNETAVLSKKQEISQRISQGKERLERIARLRETLYDDYLGQLMDERDYLFAKKRYAEQEAEQQALLAELAIQEASISEKEENEFPWLQMLLSFREEQVLTRKMALELIDKVIVYNKSSIIVWFRFEDEYQRLKAKLLPQMEVPVNG